MLQSHPHVFYTNYKGQLLKVFNEHVALKDGQVQRLCGGVVGGLDKLGEHMVKQIVDQIHIDFPIPKDDDGLAHRIADPWEVAVALRCDVFSGRGEDLDKVEKVCCGKEQVAKAFVTGMPGSGKSTFMARLCLHLRNTKKTDEDNQALRVVSHFIRLAGAGCDVIQMMASLTHAITKQCGLQDFEDDPCMDYHTVRAKLKSACSHYMTPPSPPS
jgi:hypothetical protein